MTAVVSQRHLLVLDREHAAVAGHLDLVVHRADADDAPGAGDGLGLLRRVGDLARQRDQSIRRLDLDPITGKGPARPQRPGDGIGGRLVGAGDDRLCLRCEGHRRQEAERG